jgi:hypothetical protein
LRGVQITFWLDEDEEDVYKTAEEALEFARREVELKNVDPASVEAVVVHRV